MSREIKFEIVARNIHFDEIRRQVFTLEQIWESREIDTWLRSDNCELIARRQYTGLKDKNGVEIYEGDILAVRPYNYLKADGTRDLRQKSEWFNPHWVEWGCWTSGDLQLATGWEYEEFGSVAGWNVNLDELQEYEVIGNIYENPELVG